jgi:hypothetical protein
MILQERTKIFLENRGEKKYSSFDLYMKEGLLLKPMNIKSEPGRIRTWCPKGISSPPGGLGPSVFRLNSR